MCNAVLNEHDGRVANEDTTLHEGPFVEVVVSLAAKAQSGLLIVPMI